MRIERHHIDESVVAKTVDDFTNGIGRQVRSMSKAGPIHGFEWGMLAEEFLDYLGALSAAPCGLHTAEAKIVLRDACEAAAGKVAFAAYYPVASFQVFLTYVNFGMSYDRGDSGETETISAHDWIDAFCLAVLTDQVSDHGEAFHFARAQVRQDAGDPAVELIAGLMAYVIGDTGANDEETSYPPTRAEKLAALDAALARVRPDEASRGRSRRGALRGLRALAAGDQDAFAVELADLLTAHCTAVASSNTPAHLLPLVPLALAALAYRREGWQVPVESGYLPHALVTGWETAGPRVGAYGRDRRADAVAQLASGPVEFARPEGTWSPLLDKTVAHFEQETEELLDPNREKPARAADWSEAMDDQQHLFRFRSAAAPDVTDEALRNLALASQFGAAAFRAVRDDGTWDSYDTGASRWHMALDFALITGNRDDLAPLVLTDTALLGDEGPFAWYCRALHSYFRGTDPEPAIERALAEQVRYGPSTVLWPPVRLLSQLVEGDEESFNLALLDALEAHRDHYSVADRASDVDSALNLDILALTCHARRRGWSIHVSTPYLPPRLLASAKPL
ncbi:Imm49 family immunity protein [Streptomyces sp. NPDC086554]|uniref:immunity 49 family protein n=1 Tax=Streptomyces sp. NPDC086554 TaxID=3154864 RepID=UPI00343506EC